MKLCAAVIVRNELGRYLDLCLAALLEYCDEIRVLDDSSSDGWEEALRPGWSRQERRRILVRARDRGGDQAFHRHAAGRNELLQFALEGAPSHILAIDADEFISDGAAVRRSCNKALAVAVKMCEVWEPCEERLCVRADGGWRPHDVTMIWAPHLPVGKAYLIQNRGPATGRTPENRPRVHSEIAGAACFHFGWARPGERAARAKRYEEEDGGRFHAKAHLDSILWPPQRVKLEGWAWPAALQPAKAALLERAGAEVAA